ncbi:sporulation protein [Thiocystis minor]|uniref:SPOR domain-containing protein n=1 Tax=Thiocystis minor TaxID=61597 RepID=UPI0019149B3D|nr:SPOR domain-containing protein [Thiocystis minor]MBK5964484.1 sporulation protein [Thiocystis minor]
MVKETRRGTPARLLVKRKQSCSCVWWLLLGIALGVVAGNFMSTRRDATNPQPGASPSTNRESQAAPVQPTFHFPQLLNDATVEVGDKGPPPPPPAPRPQPPVEQPQPMVEDPSTLPSDAPRPAEPVPAARSGTYVVQAGSFTSAADAERRKAELALLGISSRVQTATLPSGKTAYRVRTGAYSSKQAAEQVRAQLKRNGKEGMTIPIK